MKRAVTIPAVGDVGALVEFAVELEEAGWDGVFLWDHLQVFPDQQLPWMDPWVLLGAIATATDRVRIGTMVTPISRRRPWKLAKEALTLDHLSGGRVTLGIGLGAPQDDEFTAFGEIAQPRERAAAPTRAFRSSIGSFAASRSTTRVSTTRSTLSSSRLRCSRRGCRSGSRRRRPIAGLSSGRRSGTACSATW